jgi:hypothetical protein
MYLWIFDGFDSSADLKVDLSLEMTKHNYMVRSRARMLSTVKFQQIDEIVQIAVPSDH